MLALACLLLRAARVGLAGEYIDPISKITAQDEALYESLKAVVRTLEVRASIGQSLLKAQGRAGFEGHSEMAATGRYGR